MPAISDRGGQKPPLSGPTWLSECQRSMSAYSATPCLRRHWDNVPHVNTCNLCLTGCCFKPASRNTSSRQTRQWLCSPPKQHQTRIRMLCLSRSSVDLEHNNCVPSLGRVPLIWKPTYSLCHLYILYQFATGATFIRAKNIQKPSRLECMAIEVFHTCPPLSNFCDWPPEFVSMISSWRASQTGRSHQVGLWGLKVEACCAQKVVTSVASVSFCNLVVFGARMTLYISWFPLASEFGHCLTWLLLAKNKQVKWLLLSLDAFYDWLRSWTEQKNHCCTNLHNLCLWAGAGVINTRAAAKSVGRQVKPLHVCC